MKRAACLLTVLSMLSMANLKAEVYTIDFNCGTVSGKKINTSVSSAVPADYCSSGADFFTLNPSTLNCFYDGSGCGLRIGKESRDGYAFIILNLSEEIQSKTVVRIVVYASRGTAEPEAKLSIFAGSNTVTAEYVFADMLDYNPSTPESSSYMLPDIDLEKKFKNLKVQAQNTNFAILHRIDIYTEDDSSEDAIPSPKVSVDEMDVFWNLAGQRIQKPSRGIFIKVGKKYVAR